QELATGLFQAEVDYSLFCPSLLLSEQTKLRLFEHFWNGNGARLGEDGAVGWGEWVEKEEENRQKAAMLEESIQESEQGGWTGWSEPKMKKSEISESPLEVLENALDDDNDAVQDPDSDDVLQDEEDLSALLEKVGIDIKTEADTDVKDVAIWKKWSEEEALRDAEQWMPLRENAEIASSVQEQVSLEVWPLVQKKAREKDGRRSQGRSRRAGNPYRWDLGVPHNDPGRFVSIWIGSVAFSVITWFRPYLWQLSNSYKWVTRNGRPRHEVMIEWEGVDGGTSWELVDKIKTQFPTGAWGQAPFQEGGSDTGQPSNWPRAATDVAESSRRGRKRSARHLVRAEPSSIDPSSGQGEGEGGELQQCSAGAHQLGVVTEGGAGGSATALSEAKEFQGGGSSSSVWHDRAMLYEQYHWKKSMKKGQPYSFQVSVLHNLVSFTMHILPLLRKHCLSLRTSIMMLYFFFLFFKPPFLSFLCGIEVCI
ncbi:hypothetical protein EJ110_NYTH48114, partial [Nymphaea thermarum]